MYNFRWKSDFPIEDLIEKKRRRGVIARGVIPKRFPREQPRVNGSREKNSRTSRAEPEGPRVRLIKTRTNGIAITRRVLGELTAIRGSRSDVCSPFPYNSAPSRRV